MEVFAIHVDQKRESLADFNKRLMEFCRDNAVVAIYPNEVGTQLVLNLVPAENVEAAPGTPCLMPFVFLVEDRNDLEIEEKLNEFVRAIVETEFPDENDEPLELFPHGAVTVRCGEKKAWYVALVQYASVMFGGAEGEDGG